MTATTDPPTTSKALKYNSVGTQLPGRYIDINPLPPFQLIQAHVFVVEVVVSLATRCVIESDTALMEVMREAVAVSCPT